MKKYKTATWNNVEKAREVILGMDIASTNSKDFSARSIKCGNCNTIIDIELFEKEVTPPKHYDKCPNCEVEFNKTIVIE